MNERRYELDWLRVIAMAILVCYHTGMIFVRWEWHIKSEETSRAFELVMAWFHFWRMPLLLFISGAATAIVLKSKSNGSFLKDRFLRLFVPLVFGMFVIVPPQVYFEDFAETSSYADFYPTVFEFGDSFTWNHLWFVVYLLVFSLIALPFFRFLRSERAAGFANLLRKIVASPLGFIALLLPILATQIILRPWFPEETHDLVDDWAFFTYYLSFFVYGYVLYRDATLWNQLIERRRQNAFSGLVAAVFMYAAWLITALPRDIRDTVFDVSAIGVAWFTLLAAIGYGATYLNRPARFLAYANEAVYPVYILHQTVIITIGYYVLRAHGGVYLNFAFITAATFASCLAIHHFLIRPFSLMRLLFGMKPLRKEPTSQRSNALTAQTS